MQPLVSLRATAAAAVPPAIPSPPAATLPRPRRRISPPPLAAGALLCNHTGSGHASPRGRRPLSPAAMSHPEPHALEQRAVVVTNKHGEKLVGVLHHTGSSKIVVLCHGFISTKNDSLILDLMAALTKKGINVFRFDFSGNGESEGEFEYGNYKKEADDLHSVVSYLYTEKYEVTAIVGHSKGGDVVALYASIYDDVRLVINVSGRFDLEKGIEERIGEGSIDRINKEGYLDVKDKSGNVQYRVTKESLMERLNTDMRAVSISIGKECRFFTVHGSADETIPVEDAYEFAKHIPNHKLQVIEGANHNYPAHRKELSDAVVDFITSNLV